MAEMTRIFFLTNIKRLTDDEIAEGIAAGFISLVDLPKFIPNISPQRQQDISDALQYAGIKVDWEQAQNDDTVVAYQNFISKYSGHSLAQHAQNRINALMKAVIDAAWIKAEQDNTLAAYSSFVATYPNSDKIEEATERIADFVWDETDKESLSDLQKFLTEYPNSQHYALADAIYSELKKSLEQEDDIWEATLDEHKIAGYESYCSMYPNGKYVATARLHIQELLEVERTLKRRLIEEMRQHPEYFKQDSISKIIRYNELEWNHTIISISKQDLLDEYLISPSALGYIERGKTFNDVAHQIRKFEDLPKLHTEKTDVYFFGVPASGKSTVLASLLHLADKMGVGQYQPTLKDDNTDPCITYYQDMVACLSFEMLPPRTVADTCNLMSVDILSENFKKKNPLNFIEIGGEYFINATESLMGTGRDISQHGATQFLSNNNRKILFFLIDYSKVVEAGSAYDIEQQNSLARALHIFSQGTNPVFSKTDTVSVIISKADKMGDLSEAEQKEEAIRFLKNRYASFMQGLKRHCQTFGMNKASGYSPQIMTYSVGRVGVGDTATINYQDPNKLLNFIRNNSRSYSLEKSLFGKIADALKF